MYKSVFWPKNRIGKSEMTILAKMAFSDLPIWFLGKLAQNRIGKSENDHFDQNSYFQIYLCGFGSK